MPNNEFERLKRQQEIIESDYEVSCGLTKEQIADLHQFFSPWVVPIGLTDNEVLICCGLYHIKKIFEGKRLNRALKNEPLEVAVKIACTPSYLPQELGPFEPMTRERFRIGVGKFLDCYLVN